MAGGTSAGAIIGRLRILVDADTSKAQDTLRKLGGKSGVIGTAIGAGVGAFGIQALKMGDTWDTVMDGMRASTGLTGEGCCDANNDNWYCTLDGVVFFLSCG